MESESGLRSVRELIRKEVADWDDEAACRARFKDFSGQRSDWEPIYFFWRDLILNITRHFGLLIIRPSQVKTWFNRGGLIPLCLDRVLVVMRDEGDIVGSEDLDDPTTGRVSQILRKVRKLVIKPNTTSQQVLFVISVLKDKSAQLLNNLSTDIITMSRFHQLCGPSADEASAILTYLSSQRKARYFSLNKGDLIQGVKLSLSTSPVSLISTLDCDNLLLVWTAERLQQHLNLIDQRCQRSKESALTCLKSGNKSVALRHMRAFKVANASREKCATLFNRVDEILDVIANAESTKKVSEAIQIGAQAMKENNISLEQVQQSLQELEESIDLQKQLENALESAQSHTCVDEEDIKEEFKKLELEIGSENPQQTMPKIEALGEAGEASPESLCDAFSNLNVVDGASRTRASQDTAAKKTKHLQLEPA
ncbi:hypothetical protein UlMin_045474 [Ulmus minor]